MRRTAGVLVGAALLGVLALALGSILKTAVDLEDAEHRARRLAAHEERVRLALWRMDSTLSTFLAYENAQPVAPPDDHRPADQPFIERRFIVGPPFGDDSLPPHETMLAELEVTPMSFSLVPSARQEAKRMDPVEQEASSQRQSNLAEFSQRLAVAGQQSQFVSDSFEPPSAEATDADEMRSNVVEPASSPAPASSAPILAGAGLLRPLWFQRGTEDRRSLLLVRRVVRDGEGSLQGLVLDFDATRRWLLGEIGDLLPAADLAPVLDSATADPGRRLALLPLRLQPGPAQPLVADAVGWSPARLGLTVAVAAVAVVVLAGLLVLLAGLSLARRRSDFATAVIHELRTPLTTFRFYTDMLAEGMVPEADRQRYAETLRREADRLGHLVENVLAYAHLERKGPSRAPSRDECVGLADWAKETAERLASLAEDEGFTFSWQARSDLDDISLAADPLAAERILHNLCDNSCKYGRGEAARIEVAVSVNSRRSRATLHWRDHGPGLTGSARRSLFRAFRRGPDVTGTAGIGLGLALSRQLARRFGGDLRRATASGPGTAFELILPVTASPGLQGKGASPSRDAPSTD